MTTRQRQVTGACRALSRWGDGSGGKGGGCHTASSRGVVVKWICSEGFRLKLFFINPVFYSITTNILWNVVIVTNVSVRVYGSHVISDKVGCCCYVSSFVNSVPYFLLYLTYYKIYKCIMYFRILYIYYLHFSFSYHFFQWR